MQLHQFRHSPFCAKVRLVLAFKRLDYSVVEVTPGLGQISLFQLSGQRQVPVLVDGPEVIADSSAIALYLEDKFPTPALLPADPLLRSRALLLEDWADTSLASGARMALLQAAALDPQLRSELLPEATPELVKQFVDKVPNRLFGGLGDALGSVMGAAERQHLQANLQQLAVMVAAGPYLVGSSLSLADLAVAAQLAFCQVPGLADHPLLEPLFSWRDRIEAETSPA
ncbi:glutathione S-transferase family protein [Cyanobium sp. HWJ4-Hawea]|uniref:glutathione S-transferase family protein n=1 Tax=Cyanobium sp. HWJ4-Hawea TaxID=2823713 RepID=UPI0020CF65A9|nr:glutathione S-transferase family protein [Cyanobium sp. HWJ4-Hawea]MCP9809923.1 glutathione S-transferase family protein [Cyanobium sp. HWJ4-Hawea]